MNKKLSFLLLFISSSFFSSIYTLTTLQYYDPSPVYCAKNSLMPPNSSFVHLKQAKKKGSKPNKKRIFEFNVSGFVQGACYAQPHTKIGTTKHGSVNGSSPAGQEMGDFRGTLYPFGLFLGYSPNGYSIWANGIDTGAIDNIVPDSINNTQLPSYLRDIVKILSGNYDTTTGIPTATGASITAASAALLFNPDDTNGLKYPSIFYAEELDKDTAKFGAYSLPIDYRKQGLRCELNIQVTEHISLLLQGGIANIKQTIKGSGLTSLSQTSGALYDAININSSPDSATRTAAQATFNTQFSNNSKNILDSVNQKVENFDSYSIEDLRAFLTFYDTYNLNRFMDEEEDDGLYAEMLFTPYCWVGGSCPLAEKKDYTNVNSLAFGNNGHPSVGGAIGMSFDFVDTIEVGLEGGVTYFLSQKEKNRPFPTHKLQRGVYPFSASEITSEPGLNWHFKAMMHAYQFLPHVSFWATYEYIEHRRDNYRFPGTNTVQPLVSSTGAAVSGVGPQTLFVQDSLVELSDWKAHFFNAGLVFDIQPGMQASLVWQQPINPLNAYYPVTVLGSLSFQF